MLERVGNAPRNLLRADGIGNVDFSLIKNTRVRHGQNLQVRVEMFNVINHPNLPGPQTDITNANFGRVITKDGNRRDIQLALRYLF